MEPPSCLIVLSVSLLHCLCTPCVPSAESCVLLADKCSLDLLESQFVPLFEELRERAISLWQDEQYLYATWSSVGEERQIQKTEALNKVPHQCC